MTALKQLLGMGLVLLACGPARALEVPSADVMIQSITATPDLKLKVVVFSYWDDTARNVRLQITLPPGLKVVSLPVYCMSVAMADGTHGSISCDVGDMNVNTTRTVDIALARSYAFGQRTAGVFVWNTLPDPMPSNNFALVTLP